MFILVFIGFSFFIVEFYLFFKDSVLFNKDQDNSVDDVDSDIYYDESVEYWTYDSVDGDSNEYE